MAYVIGLDGLIKHATIAEADGVTEIYETPAPTEAVPEPQPVLVGYRVAVPYKGGFFTPKFDMTKWANYVALRDASPEYTTDPETGEQTLTLRVLPDPSDCWVEALTPEEIAQRTAPPPLILTPDQERIAQLENENTILQQKADEAQQIAAATSTDLQALMDYLAGQGVI